MRALSDTSRATFAGRKADADAINTTKRERLRLLSMGEVTIWGESGGRKSKPVAVTFESLVDYDRGDVYRRYKSDPGVISKMDRPGTPDIVEPLGTIAKTARLPMRHAPAEPDRIMRANDQLDW